MPTKNRWVILLGIIYLLVFAMGCSRSGRELSDAQWLSLHAKMQQERAEVGQQRDLLEADRRKWQARERSEPVVAAAISTCGLLVCCALPLVLVTVLLWPRQHEPATDAVNELLIEEVASQIASGGDEIKRLDHSANPARLATRQT